MFVIVYCGHHATKEAERTKETFEELSRQNSSNYSAGDKIDLILLMTQVRSRDLNIQNVFFKINFKVLLTVSCELIHLIIQADIFQLSRFYRLLQFIWSSHVNLRAEQ